MTNNLPPENVLIPAINDDLRLRTKPITKGSPPDLYLRSRGINMVKFPPDLRMDNQGNMVSVIRDAMYGIGVGYQTTILRQDGTHYRRFSSGLSIPDGSAVRLGRAEAVMGVAEGVETALSAFNLSTVPVWATCGSARLETWIAPKGVESVYIFADHDSHGQGERSAEILAERLNNRGIITEIVTPKQLGDWNDYVQDKRGLNREKTEELVMGM